MGTQDNGEMTVVEPQISITFFFPADGIAKDKRKDGFKKVWPKVRIVSSRVLLCYSRLSKEISFVQDFNEA